MNKNPRQRNVMYCQNNIYNPRLNDDGYNTASNIDRFWDDCRRRDEIKSKRQSKFNKNSFNLNAIKNKLRRDANKLHKQLKKKKLRVKVDDNTFENETEYAYSKVNVNICLCTFNMCIIC